MRVRSQRLAWMAIAAVLAGCGGPEDALRRQVTRGKGVIVLPVGVTEISVPIEIPEGSSGMEITGSAGSILRMRPGFQGKAAIVARKASGLTLRGFAIEGWRPLAEQPLELAPPENAFRVFYSNNGIVLDEVRDASISDVYLRDIAAYAILVSRSERVRIDRVAVADSGSRNAKGRNNGSGGVLIEEGSSDFSVTRGDFRRIRGNAVWTHSLFTSPYNRDGVFADNTVDTVARDAFQVGSGRRIRVERNVMRRVGYPVELVDNENQATPVGVDTAGDVSASVYAGNRMTEVNGKCFDLDGFHDGEVSGNTCRNADAAEAYPNGHFAVAFNNNDPRMQSRNVRIAGNTFQGMKFGGVFLMGQGHVVEDNAFEDINRARCNDRPEMGCLFVPAEPDLLRSGVYLSRGVLRMEDTRGNTIRRNRISGYGMRSRCVAAAPGVSAAANTVAGNVCADLPR